MSQPFDIAIIGAGLSGLALALALKNSGIACTLYESHDAPLDTGGGMMLTPNGLAPLRAIGIHSALLESSYTFDKIYLQHGQSGAILETIEYGNADVHGFRAMRVHRFTLLELLLAKVREQGIPIHFKRKFSHIVDETEKGVTWQFTDGSTESASLLVGADGIHSTVRRYIAPDVRPEYTGNVNLTATIPTSHLQLPVHDLADLRSTTNKHPLPSGIVEPGLGAFVIAPESKTGDQVLIAAMRHFPDEPKDGRWANIDSDKPRLRAWFQENAERFPAVVQNAVRDIPDKDLHIWPNYGLSNLKGWTSSEKTGSYGRVLVLGDAAHAIPPSGGQGVNQAFEDTHLLALVLGRLGTDIHKPECLQAGLHGWQRFRQDRIKWVYVWNRLMEIRRLPADARAESGYDVDSVAKKTTETADTIFGVGFDAALADCLREYHKSSSNK